MRPENLRGAAADAYRMWRETFGLSEQCAMRALEQDGLISLGMRSSLGHSKRHGACRGLRLRLLLVAVMAAVARRHLGCR
jgi:hypothetical protein